MSSELAIATSKLGKAYQIYRRPIDRLKQMLWRGRRKFYDEFWALHDISFEVYRGETIGIIGRNGSGKSTLLQLICGTLSPTCGALHTSGRIAALLELGAGFNPEFSGRENVQLAASILGLSPELIAERYEQIVEFAGIGDFIEQPVKTYSSGMYARLAFAVAAHVDADILIIDEILSVGDAAFNQKCMRFINEFRKHGTIFFVSHDISAVLGLCDKVVWLDAGRMRESGDPKEVCRNYLAAVQSEKEDVGAFQIGGQAQRVPDAEPADSVDHRKTLLESSELRNIMKVFEFNPEAPWFGFKGATVERVTLVDTHGRELINLVGGEEVILRVVAQSHRDMTHPITGFYVKDRLGQALFGDNTYLTYKDSGFKVQAGEEFITEFQFRMPYLPTGEFAVTVAISEGTQDEHVNHYWVDEALVFRVDSSHVAKGLVGIPMTRISFSGRDDRVRAAV